MNSLAGLHRRVDSHLHCQKCDYDLFGLRFGGRCPECGTAIRPPVRVHGSVNDAPIAALNRLRNAVFALVAATISLPLAIVAIFIPTSLAVALLLFSMLASASWVYGVFILTAPLPGRPSEELDRTETTLRVATRAATASWFFVLGIPLIYRIGVPFSPIALYLVWLGSIVAAGIGFTLLSISLSRLAAWANDLDLAHQLRGAAVAVVFLLLGVVVLTALSMLGLTAGVLLFFYLAAGLVGIGLTIRNIVLYVRLTAILAWAPANAQKALERARAKGERAAQRIAEGQAKHEELPHYNVVKPPIRGVVVAPTHDAAIDLAPEEQPSGQSAAPSQASSGSLSHLASTPLPPLPKKKPVPAPNVNRKKDEMI